MPKYKVRHGDVMKDLGITSKQTYEKFKGHFLRVIEDGFTVQPPASQQPKNIEKVIAEIASHYPWIDLDSQQHRKGLRSFILIVHENIRRRVADAPLGRPRKHSGTQSSRRGSARTVPYPDPHLGNGAGSTRFRPRRLSTPLESIDGRGTPKIGAIWQTTAKTSRPEHAAPRISKNRIASQDGTEAVAQFLSSPLLNPLLGTLVSFGFESEAALLEVSQGSSTSIDRIVGDLEAHHAKSSNSGKPMTELQKSLLKSAFEELKNSIDV